jgi:hypothetical protein
VLLDKLRPREDDLLQLLLDLDSQNGGSGGVTIYQFRQSLGRVAGVDVAADSVRAVAAAAAKLCHWAAYGAAAPDNSRVGFKRFCEMLRGAEGRARLGREVQALLDGNLGEVRL